MIPEKLNLTERAFLSAVRKGRVQLAEKLLHRGADVRLSYIENFTRKTVLMQAASTGDLAMVQMLLRHGARVRFPFSGYSENSPLVQACKGGHSAVIRCLLEAGANPMESDDEELPALYFAVQHDIPEAVELLLAAGANVRDGGHTESLLTKACFCGNIRCVRVLLQYGAKADTGALAGAAAMGNLALVQELLARGADPSGYFMRDGKNALAYAMTAHPFCPEIAELLLDGGCDINETEWYDDECCVLAAARSRKGSAEAEAWALSHGALSRFPAEPQEAPTDILRLVGAAERGPAALQALLETGVNLNGEWEGRTALTAACIQADGEAIHTLLEAGADPNKGSRDVPLNRLSEKLPLSYAALLLEHGADPNLTKWWQSDTRLTPGASTAFMELVAAHPRFCVNQQNEYSGTTPLLAACRMGAWRVVKILLERGADLLAQNRFQQNVLHVVAETPFAEASTFIRHAVAHGVPVNAPDITGATPLLCTSTAAAFRLLWELGADLQSRDAYGYTALMNAARCGDAALITDVLAAGGRLHEQDMDGDTALSFAVTAGAHAVVRVLLESGAMPPGAEARSALLAAAVSDYDVAMAELLLQYGAAPNVTDDCRQTALHLLCRESAGERQLSCALLLLQYGARADIRDIFGCTAAEMAEEGGLAELSALLAAQSAG